ncbi:hypothetical protein [Halarchaeum nitratireducens]|uniref:Uncharacterized protein n=1 Tax=Halarchaeum nitratireducens TaxID=489913 RepID=A0A830G9J1_9EURY|nr:MULTISPECIES: hypothetical protein [Halarchaeum]MBP2250074.1 hypothetical protein [Halarchaeum solikamskense]GGN08648.1 hypothetical protein GCM10009021_05090 [Halarchaeum nitratireducens]
MSDDESYRDGRESRQDGHDSRAASPGGSGVGRRGFLTATGAALAASLAGCGGRFGGGDPAPDYDVDALAATLDPLPDVPVAVPVQPSREHVSAARERVRALLDGDVSRVPNAVVRDRLAAEREDARDALADSPSSRLDAVSGLAHPRGEAMFVRAGLAAFDGDLTRSDVAARRERVTGALDAFEANRRYVGGDDPVAALVEHVEIGSWRADAHSVLASTVPDAHDPENDVLGVAEHAKDVEWGRATLADARRLAARYRGTLSDPVDYGGRFAAAAAALADALPDDATARPDFDAAGTTIERGIADTAAATLLRELRRSRWQNATDVAEERSAGRSPLAVASAMRALVEGAALADATAAIRDGAYARPDAIDVIAAEREAAVDALRTLREDGPAPLASRVASSVRARMRWADRDVRDGVDDRSLADDVYADYAYAHRVAAAAPPVLDRVADAVRGTA